MSLWTELKRRNIFRVAAAYVVIGWLTLQVADIVLGFTGAPEWVGKALIALLLLGVIPVLALAWVFEVTPEGIRIDDGSNQRDVSPQARRLDVVTLGAVVLVMLLMVGQHLAPALLSPDASDTPTVQESASPSGSTTTADPAPAESHDTPVDNLVAPEGSIAVLPFTNRSSDPDTEYFVDGVHDDLLTELSRNPQLTVISRTSVMQYRGTTKTLRTIGNELGVAHVLEGAVQRAGQRVRINAQLIDAETDAHLWADTFDRELTPENVFDIQTEIATAIARALGRTLSSTTQPTSGSAVTRSAEAFDAYLRARSSDDLISEPIIRQRISLYREALEYDPEFATAMGELGREYTNLYWYVSRRDADRQLGGEWIDRALRLEPDNPILQMARAEHLYRADLDYAGALAALEDAEARLPGDARIFMLRAYIQRRANQPEATIASLTTSALLDPRSIEVLQTLFETHWLLGDLENARGWHERLVEIPAVPRSTLLNLPYAELALRANADDAIAELRRLPVGGNIGLSLFNYIDRFYWPFLARDYAFAEQQLAQLDEEFDIIEDQFTFNPIALLESRLASARGDAERQVQQAESALGVLDRALEQRPNDYRAWSTRGLALALIGREEDAVRSFDRSLSGHVPSRDAMIHGEVLRTRAIALAQVARTPTVIEAVEAYLGRTMKYYSIHGLILDPAFDRHVDDPAFQALIARHAREDAVR
ncbi:hypothetical protein [Halomonas denitrificans]|nr:hypothetical protein [Halomonas denitrificans]